MSYRINMDKKTMSLEKVKTTARKVIIRDMDEEKDEIPYKATAIGKNAFKNVRASKIDIQFDVKKIRKNAFNGAEISKLLLKAGSAATFNIEKGAFDNMKRMQKTTVRICARDYAEYRKIVAKFKKAGGEKFKYEFRQLED